MNSQRRSQCEPSPASVQGTIDGRSREERCLVNEVSHAANRLLMQGRKTRHRLLSFSITSVVSNCSLKRCSSVDAFFLTKGLGSGARRRSAPHKQECTCPATLNAWSRPLWPLFRRECRGAIRRSARVPLNQLDNTAPEVMIASKLALNQRYLARYHRFLTRQVLRRRFTQGLGLARSTCSTSLSKSFVRGFALIW